MADCTSTSCRICLQEIEKLAQFYALDDNELKTKLLNFYPEVDLALTLNPVLCYDCMTTINRIHKFKQLCLETERTLRAKNDTIKVEFAEVTIKEEVPETEVADEKQYYYCDKCCYFACCKEELDKHVESHEIGYFKPQHKGRRKHQCDQCSYLTTVRSYLIAHKRSMHEKKYNLYKCFDCDYSTVHKSHLDQHIVMHKDYPFSCPMCEHHLSSLEALSTHVETHVRNKT